MEQEPSPCGFRSPIDGHSYSGEVRDRPAIRRVVTELAERHRRASGVREQHAAATRII
ncbi:hypothetical protein [Streptomyces fungicidicus]|uniref:hypothetical protein n=1 Tax=Streptomyces fungicidicus TaxID=68203 RepID=UPI0036B615E7